MRPGAAPPTHHGPGLVDLQLNGYAGFDFNSRPESWRLEELIRVRQALRRRGVVAALPTLITDEVGRMVARAEAYARFVVEAPELEATFPRLHIEGPFVSAEEGPRGAHPLAQCRAPAAEPELLERLWEASGGRIGIFTLAPELAGAIDLIADASGRGICVGIGHTAASPEVIADAVSAGARMSTHLGNASHQLLPRHANYIQVQLAEDRLHASFIADGHHLPWYVLRNFLRAKTPDRAILVTDAIAAADAPPGRYRLGDDEVEVSADLRVSKPGQPNLAGSALTLDRAVMNVVAHCGIDLEDAWRMASTRPASMAGLGVPESITVVLRSEGFQRLED